MQVSYRDFFKAFGYSDKDAIYTRLIHDKDKTNQAMKMECELSYVDSFIKSMERYNKDGYGVFFVVNGGGHDDKSVKAARAQFIDMDDFSFEEQWKRVNEFPLTPSIIIKTKKSLHCYWLLENGKLDLFEEVQKRLICQFGSDATIKNKSRVMRLHGFYHQKSEPVLVELVKFEPAITYTQEQLIAVLPEVKAESRQERRTDASSTFTQGNRTSELVRLLGVLQNRGFDDDMIIANIRAVNAESCSPPLTDAELEREVFPALRRWEKGKSVCDNGVARPIKQRKKLHYMTAKELLSADLPPVEYIVDVIISKGLVVLSAKSKIGKSWFALDLALAVSSGADFLGFNTTQGEVLYIDLENSKALTQQRIIRLLNGTDAPSGLTIVNDYSTMNDTFMEDITEYLEGHPKVSLVIVDVFQKIKKSKSNNKADYDDVYENFTPLKELAEKYSISLILVMHDRKMTDITDPFSNILGSTAIMGASDEVIVIHKKNRNDADATLSITGRTVQECEYSIKFNKPICKWEMLGDAAEIQEKREKEEFYSNPLVKTIVKLVNTNGGTYTGKVQEIISASEYFRTKIYKNAQCTGRDISKIAPLLEKYYSITHYAPNKGTASVPHTFRKMV